MIYQKQLKKVRKLIDRRIERALNSSYAEVAAAMPLFIVLLNEEFNNVLTMQLLNKPVPRYYNGEKAEQLNSVFRKDNNKYKNFFSSTRSSEKTIQILKAHHSV